MTPKIFFEADGGSGGGAGSGQGAGTGVVSSAGSGTGSGSNGTAVVTEPFYKGLIAEDGKINATAWDRLPDHLKPHAETFKRYQTVDELFAGFGNLNHLAGKKGLAPLPENAPEAVRKERDQLLDKLLGVPDRPELYGFKRPDDLPEEVWDEQFAGEAARIMRDGHVSAATARKLLDLNIANAKAGIAEAQARMAEEAQAEESKLRTEWAGDSYDRNMAMIDRLIRTAGLDPETAMPFTADGKIGLLKIASMMSEDKLVSGEGAGDIGAGNDRQRAMDIVNNPANPLYKAYHDGADPRSRQARELVNSLNESYARKMRAAGQPVT